MQATEYGKFYGAAESDLWLEITVGLQRVKGKQV
jgi:hypothetical protein